ncbi:MAG TPA: glycosyltransferase family 39 protein [Anaerolineales bacterium]|nr:glycosyltransferase family 39 protein [Anaerolineales bacterium]
MTIEKFLKKPNLLLTRENLVSMFIFLAGIILRLRQYLTGRSLWVDEAMLALNIVNRNFAELFKPLDYDQGAPIGFLLVEKIFNLMFGRNELALRFFPLLAGLVSLWTFYLLLKHFTREAGLLLAFTLFAGNPRLIYYSSEVKQYIVDVTVTIALLLFATHAFENPSRRNLTVLLFAGLLALWLSHPSLFILAAIGLALLISHIQKKDFANLWLVLEMGIIWLAEVGLLYFLTLRDLHSNAYMRTYWQDAFAPMPPWRDWNWYWTSFVENMDTQFAVTRAPWIMLLLILAGWAILSRQKFSFAITLAGTFFFNLLASSLKLYPSLERLTLFLVPINLLLIGKAVEWLHQSIRAHRVLSTLVLLGLGGILLSGPLPRTFEQFISPKYFQHIRPSMEFLQNTWHEGDLLYLSNGAVPAFEYYAPLYGLESVSYIAGKREDYINPTIILARIEALKGNHRVWFLITHVYEKGEFNEKDFLLDYLNQIGHKRREFRQPGTSVYLYLYDLSSSK